MPKVKIKIRIKALAVAVSLLGVLGLMLLIPHGRAWCEAGSTAAMLTDCRVAVPARY